MCGYAGFASFYGLCQIRAVGVQMSVDQASLRSLRSCIKPSRLGGRNRTSTPCPVAPHSQVGCARSPASDKQQAKVARERWRGCASKLRGHFFIPPAE